LPVKIKNVCRSPALSLILFLKSEFFLYTVHRMVKGKVRVNNLLFSISAVTHLFIIFDYRLLQDTFSVPEHWHIQFYVLALSSLFLSLLLIFFRQYMLPLLFARFITLLLIGYPLGEHLSIEIALLITIILETVYYLSRYYGVLTSSFLILITFFSQKPVNSWGTEMDRASIHNLLFMLFVSFLILFISFALKSIALLYNQKSEDLDRLDFAVKELTKINLDFQNYAASVEQDSIENERKRISREMHDIIGYTLTNQLMIIQAVLSTKQILPPQIKSLLLQSQEQTRAGMRDARNALHKLRDFSPSNEAGSKLIYKLVKTFGQVTGISISVDFSNTPNSLGKQNDKAIYRLVQEGLTNAFRHGKATRIAIIISYIDSCIHVSIWDNGRGSEKVIEGIGLKGMRERIEALQGTVETSSLQSGFTIKAKIPYKREVREDINEPATC